MLLFFSSSALHLVISSEQMDQFMLGHGFTAEVAQHKSMAASFDNNQAEGSPQSHRAQQSSSTHSSGAAENSLGKKVTKADEPNVSFTGRNLSLSLGTDIGRQAAYDARK